MKRKCRVRHAWLIKRLLWQGKEVEKSQYRACPKSDNEDRIFPQSPSFYIANFFTSRNEHFDEDEMHHFQQCNTTFISCHEMY